VVNAEVPRRLKASEHLSAFESVYNRQRPKEQKSESSIKLDAAIVPLIMKLRSWSLDHEAWITV
jgi:hypothetical protein